MIKNISKKCIIVRWDGMEKELEAGKSLDVRDLNVPQDQVMLVENKIGSKLSGQVEIIKTKADEAESKGNVDQRKALDAKESDLIDKETLLNERSDDLDKKAVELDAREKDINLREEGLAKKGEDFAKKNK